MKGKEFLEIIKMEMKGLFFEVHYKLKSLVPLHSGHQTRILFLQISLVIK